MASVGVKFGHWQNLPEGNCAHREQARTDMGTWTMEQKRLACLIDDDRQRNLRGPGGRHELESCPPLQKRPPPDPPTILFLDHSPAPHRCPLLHVAASVSDGSRQFARCIPDWHSWQRSCAELLSNRLN